MMRKIITVLMLLLFGCQASAQVSYPLGEMKVRSPPDAVAKRAQAIGIISGGSSIVPPRMVEVGGTEGFCCAEDPTWLYGQTPPFSRWLGWYWDFGGPTGDLGVMARTHFSEFAGSTCLFVYNAGHAQGFFKHGDGGQAPIDDFSPPKIREFIRRMVKEVGCDVILSSMPMYGENRGFVVHIGYSVMDVPGYHTYLGVLPVHAPPDGNPLRYWVDSVVGSITWAVNRRAANPYKRIIVSGISGGGWTATLLAAIDPRITHAYPVAGSTPLGSRKFNEGIQIGDWEQDEGIRSLGLDYQDLYLMGTIDAAGQPTRKVRMMHNNADGCCFDRIAVNGYAWWLTDYAERQGFGADNLKFYMANDTKHDIGTAIANTIILDALSE